MKCLNCGFEMFIIRSDDCDECLLTLWRCKHCGFLCCKVVGWFDSSGKPLTVVEECVRMEETEEKRKER